GEAVIDNLALYLAAGQSLHPVADWAVDQVLLYGPGFPLTAGCIAISAGCARLRDWRNPRRNIRARREQLRHGRQHTARRRHAIPDWAGDQVLPYGPGFALPAGCIAISAVCARNRDWRNHRRNIRARREQLRHDRQQMARLRDAINQEPLIPTQPGTDQTLLDACEAAWNTDTRKEKP